MISKSIIIFDKVMIVLFSDKSDFEVFVFLGLNLVLNLLNFSLFFLLIKSGHFSDFGISFSMSLKLFFKSIVMFLGIVESFPLIDVNSGVFWSLH